MLKTIQKWVYAQKFRRLRARYESETGAPSAGAPLPQGVPIKFFYIHWKAWKFKTVGASKYRSEDAFRRPPEDWPTDRLSVVRFGCEQIAGWKGLTPETALEGIGIPGFYDLVFLFHFSVEGQSAVQISPGVMLDKMEIKHVMTSEKITLFNKVRSQ